ncbi:hypothetical protein LAUMK191_03926 [Mycobacterium attenuatum]|uniref:Cupin 2 conserved barrel domain-containing protein n=1 Tax=Mycobacterium attenuatum TaxID=2341086 RepID=A0A498Q8V7_9MYCO|nr:hypothetical protein LAUMK136_03950 [Mycobacterium attenuatum]VBA57231.1 hypothetical protein LAUMK191_03926 [Mycobacterium attenuatum]
MYSLRIREDGVREPHRHPITTEMATSTGARMTVMSPGHAPSVNPAEELNDHAAKPE